ncbi:Cellulose synthase operon protein C precursor [Raoultella terrigena]|uniref:Cellulose synthase operon protein C n=1 Tax=Raoultella terrigena TaxID=577 RepID=A0A3P8JB74_RAOTE|nr:Cellulose synthase operon protein C precursor [Raoultella terrigena]
MRKFSLTFITLALGASLLPLAQAATTPAQDHLLEQVRLGKRAIVKIWCVNRCTGWS